MGIYSEMQDSGEVQLFVKVCFTSNSEQYEQEGTSVLSKRPMT